MNLNLELSIIVLCYRSEEAIIPIAEKIHNLAKSITDSFEIILVGNYIKGSGDKTKEIIREIANENPVFVPITKPKKGMMGWDMKEGLNLAKGNYVCVIDGDGQFPLESIEICYEKIKSENLDLVKTYRTSREDGVYRRFISNIYNITFKFLFPGLKSEDINSKPKILTKEALERMNLTSNDWFIDAEIMINVRRLKLKFSELPVVFYKQKTRLSFIKFGAILEFIRNLIIYRFKEFFIKK